MTIVDARAAHPIVDYSTPIIPSDLPRSRVMEYIEFATEALRSPILTEADLTKAARYDLASNPNAAIRVMVLGGKHAYPAFQFDDRGRINPLIGVSAISLGNGLERAKWWTSTNEVLGAIPATLLGTEREFNKDLLNALKALPPRQQPHG